MTIVPPWTKKDTSLTSSPVPTAWRIVSTTPIEGSRGVVKALPTKIGAALLVEGDEIGERAAGVGGDLCHRAPSRMRAVAASSTSPTGLTATR